MVSDRFVSSEAPDREKAAVVAEQRQGDVPLFTGASTPPCYRLIMVAI